MPLQRRKEKEKNKKMKKKGKKRKISPICIGVRHN